MSGYSSGAMENLVSSAILAGTSRIGAFREVTCRHSSDQFSLENGSIRVGC
jgi:hypothetical protein